jgi:hypothetical protein
LGESRDRRLHLVDDAVMKYAISAVGVLFLLVEIVAGLNSGGIGLVLVYGFAGLIGLGGTILYVRYRAANLGRELAAEVATGQAVWAAQVREMLSGGSWGVSGTLLVRPDAGVELSPDSSSLRRGAKAQSWDAGQARIALTRRRRDISGIRYDVLELWLPNDRLRRFAAVVAGGALPDAAKACRNSR